MRNAYTFSGIETVFHQYHFVGGATFPTGTYRNISGYHSVRMVWLITGIQFSDGALDMQFYLYHGSDAPVGGKDIIGPLYSEDVKKGLYKKIELTVADDGKHIIIPVAYIGPSTRIKPEVVVGGAFTGALRCFGILQMVPTSGAGTNPYLKGEG